MKLYLVINTLYSVTVIIIVSLITSCTPREDLSGISFKGQINPQRTKDLIGLNLIDKKDTVLGLFYSFTIEPDFNSQRYLILTNHKLVKYSNIDEELKGPEIINIPLDKILNIRQEIDPIDSTRILIRINKLDTILYLKHEQRDNIFVDIFDFRPPYKTSLSDQKEFYRLLLQSWKEIGNYNSLKETYNVFFDELGIKRTTADEIISRDKLLSLKNELTKYSINVIDRKDVVTFQYDKSIFQITYNYYLEKFMVLELFVEPIPESQMDILTILVTYPKHKHKSMVFPYSKRGITYKEGYVSEEITVKDIIEKHIKQ